MLFTVLSCVFNISHYFLLFRSLGVIHKGSTKHTSQLPTATEVWTGASGPQDEGSKRNQQPTVERRFHGEGTTVKDKNKKKHSPPPPPPQAHGKKRLALTLMVHYMGNSSIHGRHLEKQEEPIHSKNRIVILTINLLCCMVADE